MRRLISKLNPKKDAGMQCHTEVGNITTNFKVKIYFTLPELSVMKTVTRNFHVDDSDKGRYDMILGIDLLIALLLNIKLYEHITEADFYL